MDNSSLSKIGCGSVPVTDPTASRLILSVSCDKIVHIDGLESGHLTCHSIDESHISTVSDCMCAAQCTATSCWSGWVTNTCNTVTSL